MHAIEGVRRNHVVQDFDGVVLDDAHVGEVLLAYGFEQAADAGRMHLDAEVIVAGMLRRDDRGRLAHAETDFKHLRRKAAKDAVKVDDLRRVRDAELRQKSVVRTLLRVRNASLAQYKAADGTMRG